MRRSLLLLIAAATTGTALAQAAPPGLIHAQGPADGAAPAWTITGQAPAGWTADCCVYARGIGVDQVVYRGEWPGRPQQVMVLNVWPDREPTLADAVQADAAQYRRRDPRGQVRGFAVPHAGMRCLGQAYAGSDRVEDIVVFCDPGARTGIRLSWSMALDADDPQRKPLLLDLMHVVQGTRYAARASAAAHGTGPGGARPGGH